MEISVGEPLLEKQKLQVETVALKNVQPLMFKCTRHAQFFPKLSLID